MPESSREAIEQYGKLFVNRWDVFAAQKGDGSYVCLRKPLTHELLWHHLTGQITLGVYALDQENRARWLAFDADGDEQWAKLRDLSIRLKTREIPSYLEQSRRGGHLWLFFEEHLPGKAVRAFGQELLCLEEARVEMFPKRGENREGPGSLIRLPLGVHRRSGKRYPFVNQQGELLGQSAQEQLEALRHAQKVSSRVVAEMLGEALSAERRPAVRPPQDVTERSSPGLIDQVKQVDLFQFVSGYVHLTSGGKGHCPFHPDEHMSFSVNREGNYWNCFAGCGGGDIIHFWERWRRISRAEAIKELSTVVPR